MVKRGNNMKPEEIYKIEQAAQLAKDYLVPVLKTFFDGCIENNFTRREALELTIEYMVQMLSMPH